MGVSEGLGNEQVSPLASDLAAGVRAISANQTVHFTKYVKLVLPLDGFVFWVRADITSESAVLNASAMNAIVTNEADAGVTSAPSFDAQGSLHYTTNNRQQEDASYAQNRVIFTSLEPINDLNAVGPYVLYIGEFDGMRFAFSSRSSFFRQANLYHYAGDAVYSTLASQLIDDTSGLNSRSLIVSNSLPIWLSMNGHLQKPWEQFGNNIPLYPSYLVENGIEPPFGAVDIPPDSTRAIGAAPTLGRTLSHDQLVRERVKVTFWGVNNDAVMTFMDFVNQFTLNDGGFGLMNSPVPRDAKFVQVEINAIAQKKMIEFEINYYQQSARNVARQLILRAVPSYHFN